MTSIIAAQDAYFPGKITCGALGEEQGGAEERVAGAPSSAALPRLGHRGLDGTFLKTEKSETCLG